MSNTVTAGNYYKKCYVQALDMMDKLVLDRSPAIVRKPFQLPTPADTTLWAQEDHAWLPYIVNTDPAHPTWSNRRPPEGKGAPGPTTCPPELNGENRVGHKVRVDFKGTWTRHSNRADSFCYLWLRDGAPHPDYNGAPIGSKPGCECCGPGLIYYVIKPEDAGHKISCLVTLTNDEDSATNVQTEEIQILGNKTDAQVEQELTNLSQMVTDMHLANGPTSELTNTIAAIRNGVQRGESPCQDLDNLKNRIAFYVSRDKITASQQSSLNTKIDQIKALYPC